MNNCFILFEKNDENQIRVPLLKKSGLSGLEKAPNKSKSIKLKLK